jgi:hypothetical protein
MFRFEKVNYLAVIAAWIAAIAVGSLWYGVFFMKNWSEAVGIAQGDMANPALGMLVMAVCYFILVLGVALVFVAAGVKRAGSGVAGGLMISFFFLVTTLFTNVMFENRPMSLFFINGSYSLVKFAIAGAILGGWQRKTE